MKVFQFAYEDDENLKRKLDRLRKWMQQDFTSQILFHVFSENTDCEIADHINQVIEETLPEGKVMGCSTNGNILEGDFLNQEITIIGYVFEYPSTKIDVLQYEVNAENLESVAADLARTVQKRPWVKGVEVLGALRGISATPLCRSLSSLPEGIQVFGGGAFASDINSDVSYVFSSGHKAGANRVVFTLIGGEDVYIHSTFITGWKPLGRELFVTRARGNILYELDGKPAFNTYYRYLGIENDENFFYNTLEFPFFYRMNGLDILRAPVQSNSDGSLTMTSDIDQYVKARIAYGDPATILDIVRTHAAEMASFRPDAIEVFSCAARRTFWGSKDVGRETLPFESIAPTSGFYTSAEFLRTNGFVNQHNVTLVLAGIREGEIDTTSSDYHYEPEETPVSRQVSMINRLANFIQASTDELEEANRKLRVMALRDGLTGLYNRSEIQRQITSRIEEGLPTSLIMIDIDNFKRVNDSFGHHEGDTVLRGLSSMLKVTLQELPTKCQAGRWGGEEFMIYAKAASPERVKQIAETLRTNFSAIAFPKAGHQTISVGVTVARKNENPDVTCSRVDEALYAAKWAGKDCVVVM